MSETFRIATIPNSDPRANREVRVIVNGAATVTGEIIGEFGAWSESENRKTGVTASPEMWVLSHLRTGQRIREFALLEPARTFAEKLMQRHDVWAHGSFGIRDPNLPWMKEAKVHLASVIAETQEELG